MSPLNMLLMSTIFLGICVLKILRNRRDSNTMPRKRKASRQPAKETTKKAKTVKETPKKNAEKEKVGETCRICLLEMEDPYELPCGHSFCKGCIQKTFKARNDGYVQSCPMCRAVFHTTLFKTKKRQRQ
ncbi:nuclear factor 7, brain-like [Drosophila obscura]|uniref:nuclear factor 7, brain-like n=1 Tax=Drosophila obscura TaxID=7282 RepID=UPI000BA12989|nr:nuclear factor 7, brain-like [Drosophila obscura]